MPFRWIEVLAPCEKINQIRDAAARADISDVLCQEYDDGRCSIRLLAGEIDRQALIDDLKDHLEGCDARIILVATEGVTPRTDEEKKREEASIQERQADSITASREEIMDRVALGAVTTADFVVLVALSTIVATVALLEDDIAVLIGAMVLAPLLGPNLALAFGAAVGDRGLIVRAIGTALFGIAETVALAALIAWVMSPDLEVPAIAARSQVEAASLALALASGAAAALSITSGLSGTLVGVMVSVALLPPAAVAGIAIAAGALEPFAGAMILLATNSVGVTLAALTCFLAKGIRPRRWHERENANQSLMVTIPALVVALAALALLIATGLDGRDG